MMKHLLSATLILLGTLSYAQVPNSFSSGETISSSQINANFAYLANSIKNDEVTAMMVCGSSGYNESKYYYGNCFSTDNTTFNTNAIELNFSYYHSYVTYVSPNNNIEFKELFNNKWILYNSDISAVTRNSDVYTIQKHIFYKISDQ